MQCGSVYEASSEPMCSRQLAKRDPWRQEIGAGEQAICCLLCLLDNMRVAGHRLCGSVVVVLR